MKKIILASFIALGATSAFCQEWVKLGENESTRVDARAGTLGFGKTKAGTPIVFIQGRVFHAKNSSYAYEKWYVSVADCKVGYGKLVTLKLDGEFSYENDFVANGGSIGSAIADTLCYPVKEQDGKGV